MVRGVFINRIHVGYVKHTFMIPHKPGNGFVVDGYSETQVNKFFVRFEFGLKSIILGVPKHQVVALPDVNRTGIRIPFPPGKKQ